MTYYNFWKPLTSVYTAGEAKAIAQMVLELRYGMTLAKALSGDIETIDSQELSVVQERLLKGEPVQYVLGVAEFGGRPFRVNNDVLIPRPETFELCQWAIEQQEAMMSQDGRRDLSILDVCTGSGCIACTLAMHNRQAHIEGWDISEKALDVARENAGSMNVSVTFDKQDVLSPTLPCRTSSAVWDLIVSNPPYICKKEQKDMERHVLEHEPAIALFVPDDDPLLFYRHIAAFAYTSLQTGGQLLYEINPLYVNELTTMLHTIGFSTVECREDQFGKQRFMRICR